MDGINPSLIRERYQRVRDQISAATIRSGRTPGTARLVTVTKSQPVEVVREVIAAGATRLGENYAEEAMAKINGIRAKTVEWHMIGHIQSRKADLVASNFDMVHSLDSVKLAARLDRLCAESGRTLPALLEVNVSGEESKFGLPAWEDRLWPGLEPVLEKILSFTHLRILGTMTMPPFREDPELTRPFFRLMRRLQDYLVQRFPQGGWEELSMGTSADYIVAIEEGATFVRVGRSILGPRPAGKPDDN